MIDEILGKLDKKTRDRFNRASEVAVEKIPLASNGLTHALDGGIGMGRQTVVWGNKSAGKSSIMLQTVGKAQKAGKSCAWIDAENSFEPGWATRLGVDTSELIVSKAKSIDDFIHAGTELMYAGLDLIVVDSISAMLPSTYFVKDKDELQAGLDGTRQIGTHSKELGIGVNKLNFANKNTALVLISQARNQFNTYGAVLKPQGGQAMMFFSSTVVKLWANPSEKEQITRQIPSGNKLIDEAIGRSVDWTVEYNKIGPPGRKGSYDFYYGGDTVGVDLIGEAVDLAERMAVISKGGAWYSFWDQNLQGRAKTISWFKEDPDRLEKLLEEINAKI